MKHVHSVTRVSAVPMPAASGPFTKVCLMSGGSVSDDTCRLPQENVPLFEFLAALKGVSYSG